VILYDINAPLLVPRKLALVLAQNGIRKNIALLLSHTLVGTRLALLAPRKRQRYCNTIRLARASVGTKLFFNFIHVLERRAMIALQCLEAPCWWEKMA
jgi:hypothetical protein